MAGYVLLEDHVTQEKMKSIGLQLYPEQHQRLLTFARIDRRSMGFIIRDAIDAYLASRKVTPEEIRAYVAGTPAPKPEGQWLFHQTGTAPWIPGPDPCNDQDGRSTVSAPRTAQRRKTMNELIKKLKVKWGSQLAKAGVPDSEINRFLAECARMIRD
jgi:predicted transcriptional regulator